MSLLEAKNICRKYRVRSYNLGQSGMLEAIKNISFALEKGETLAIVGESGSGKSTLARQIIGIEKPTRGDIFFENERLEFANKKHRKNRFRNIRMIFQNPYESLNPQARIGKILDDVLSINTDLNPKQRKQKIESTLSRVGLLPEHRHRYPHMFSGGQRQRVAIARAIILDPKVIIADEPLSALDVSIQAQILNLLQELQEEMGMSYLFISHDLNVVEHIADHVLVMYQGEVVESGSVSQVFDRPVHPYTQSLFASTPMYRKRFPNFQKPRDKKIKNVKKGACCFAERCPYSEQRCQVEHPDLITKEDSSRVACFKNEN
ncbi:oligopeptide/dipeptide ABC transporter ATP-binding protein [Aliikangiella marina]|uniref:oligopeptide/dipeptide ABC transporter ATP-binding protein n=1 Tax=Aliikangiella marina TaxID=1712262 RepID=UPI001AED4B82|nr:oligopeptide/dipeptide ABC transporter ATP-binding protein [Aliikangiella marina]